MFVAIPYGDDLPSAVNNTFLDRTAQRRDCGSDVFGRRVLFTTVWCHQPQEKLLGPPRQSYVLWNEKSTLMRARRREGSFRTQTLPKPTSVRQLLRVGVSFGPGALCASLELLSRCTQLRRRRGSGGQHLVFLKALSASATFVLLKTTSSPLSRPLMPKRTTTSLPHLRHHCCLRAKAHVAIDISLRFLSLFCVSP